MKLFASRWTPVAIVIAAYLAMLWWTWGAWPDVLVDFGRELYAPWQLSLGKVLYRDIAWLNGPLSPYLNATWFWLFGVGVRSLVIGNLVLLAFLLWLLSGIVVKISDRGTATLVSLTLVMMFGFASANYNFVAPYSHELTHGVLLSLVALACFGVFLTSGTRVAIAGGGIALGLTFLTKAEVFLAVAVALVVGVIAAIGTGVVPRERRASMLWPLILGATVPVSVAFALFWRVMPASDALRAVAGAWRYVAVSGLSSMVFYQRLAGLLDLRLSLESIVLSATVYGVVFTCAGVASMLSPKYLRDRVLGAGVAFGAGMVFFGWGTRMVAWDAAARPLPLFMLLLIGLMIAGLLRYRRDADQDRSRAVLQLTLAVFALVLLARIAFNATFYRYGFALAMPATVVLLIALIHWIPARLSAAGGDGHIFRALALAGWLVLIGAHLNGMSGYLATHTVTVAAGADAFVADSRAVAVNTALEEIAARTSPGQTLVALPEGVMLNYLSRRANPTPYLNFMPPELVAFGEQRIVDALAAQPPDYIALVHKDTTEYGVPFFGRDYGRLVLDWVHLHYREVITIGAAPLQDSQFGIRLLELKTRQ